MIVIANFDNARLTVNKAECLTELTFDLKKYRKPQERRRIYTPQRYLHKGLACDFHC